MNDHETKSRPGHGWLARCDRGQATVELALVLPIVVLLLLVTIQAAVLVRDRIMLVNAARAAGRAVIVSPRIEAANEALQLHGRELSAASVVLDGQTTSGGLATVTLRMPATRVPVVGRVVAGVTLEESLTVRVEGPG